MAHFKACIVGLALIGLCVADLPKNNKRSLFGEDLGLSYGSSLFGLGYGSGISAYSPGYGYAASVPTRVSQSHQVESVSVPQPYPVPVTRHVPVSVPHPVPVSVPRAVPVSVPHPVPVTVDRPYPVEVPRSVPVSVPHPVPYTVSRPVPYNVPAPYPVEIRQAVPFSVPTPVVAAAPVISYSAPSYAAAYGSFGASDAFGVSSLSSYGSHFGGALVSDSLSHGHLAAGYKK